jgi:mannose-6-phosphate isomerase-like protein (cupin superfamily)
MTAPLDLSRTPIHLAADVRCVVPLPGFGFDPPAFERYVAEHCPPGAPGRLMMVETTPKDWPSWECHPAGDEIVVVLDGEGDLIQEIDGTTRRIPVRPGSAIVNPAGVWHTANVRRPLKAIYITPCPGTQHRAR